MQPLSSKALHSWEPTKANHRGSFYTVKIEKKKRDKRKKNWALPLPTLYTKRTWVLLSPTSKCAHTSNNENRKKNIIQSSHQLSGYQLQFLNPLMKTLQTQRVERKKKIMVRVEEGQFKEGYLIWKIIYKNLQWRSGEKATPRQKTRRQSKHTRRRRTMNPRCHRLT